MATPANAASVAMCNDGGTIVFDWGSPGKNKGGSWKHSSFCLSDLEVALSADDVIYLLELHLGIEDERQADFSTLLCRLGANTRDDGSVRVTKEWIEELLALVPRYILNVDGQGEENTYRQLDDAVAFYASNGYAMPLTVLYLLTIRGSFWRNQLFRYCDSEQVPFFPECADPESYGHAHCVADLAGDPVNLSGRAVSRKLYGCRSDMMSHWTAYGNPLDSTGDPSHNWIVTKNIVNSLDILSRVVATVDPRLARFLRDFDAANAVV